MIDKLKQYWWIGTICIAIASFAFWLYSIDAQASAAKEKADKLEAVAEKTAELNEKMAAVVAQMLNPQLWLRNYLIVRGIDTNLARIWSSYAIGPVRDSLGHPIEGVPYLEEHNVPRRGCLTIWSGGEPLIVDTLWNFRE